MKLSSSRLPSARSMLFLILAWLAIFLETLQCFAPVSPRVVIPVGESSPTSLLSSSSTIEPPAKDDSPTDETDTTDIKITLPSYANDKASSSPSLLHHLYVRSLLSDDEVGMALKLAIDYAESNGRFNNPDEERHM